MSMAVSEGSLGGTQATPRGHGRHALAGKSPLPVSLVAFGASIGVLLVAAAYAAGRLGYSTPEWANRSYWLGQVLIVAPTASRLLGRRAPTTGEITILIGILTVSEYLVTVCYSPAAFTFADELEHWRSTVNVLQTGKLTSVNYMLPISPHYPGLEEVTSALVSITGLPIFTCGLIISGVAHLLFVYVLYIIFREVSNSYRIGGVAVLCYACNPHFASFDSMFLYQTLALPFLGLTLLAAWHLGSRQALGERVGWLSLAVLMAVATVVTHHVTSYVLVATLAVVSLVGLLTGNRTTAAWTAFLALLSAVAAIGWLVFAAPDTWTYLKPYADQTVQSFQLLFGGQGASAPSTSSGPLSDRLLAAAAVLTVSALLPVGWWRVWREYRRQPWPVTMAIMSASWYVIVAIRFAVADGSELAGRAATFSFVPTAYILALAVGYLAAAAVRRQARAVAVAVLLVVLIFMFDGLANGWPPYWERLPGSHQVAGAERSVGPEEIAAARWTLEALGPGNRFAADGGNSPVLGAYGDQDPILDVGFLYLSPTYSLSDLEQVQAQEIRYILVDQRLSQSLPASGQYFPIDPNAGRYRHPIPLPDLTKFNNVPGVARIYDDGNIVIYDLSGGGNAP